MGNVIELGLSFTSPDEMLINIKENRNGKFFFSALRICINIVEAGVQAQIQMRRGADSTCKCKSEMKDK